MSDSYTTNSPFSVTNTFEHKGNESKKYLNIKKELKKIKEYFNNIFFLI